MFGYGRGNRSDPPQRLQLMIACSTSKARKRRKWNTMLARQQRRALQHQVQRHMKCEILKQNMCNHHTCKPDCNILKRLCLEIVQWDFVRQRLWCIGCRKTTLLPHCQSAGEDKAADVFEYELFALALALFHLATPEHQRPWMRWRRPRRPQRQHQPWKRRKPTMPKQCFDLGSHSGRPR